MDPAVTRFDVAIAGYGAVTALGCGVRCIENAIAANTSALRPHAEYAGRGYQSDVAARISWTQWAEIAALCPDPAGSAPWRLAAAAAAEAFRGLKELRAMASEQRGELKKLCPDIVHQ